MYKFGVTQKKIMLVLLGGLTLGMTRSPSQYYKTLKAIKRDWERIDQRSFKRSVNRLSQQKLVEERKFKNGSIKLVLTDEGRREAKKIKLIGNSIKFKKPKKWDRKWRIVIFDIPEKDRNFRDILRQHLKDLMFFKLQHSVFVSPFPFEKPILELIDLYSAQSYVRVITAIDIDNHEKLEKYFQRWM